jgi:enoyl-CoA hydratase/carnithine racemase
MADLLLSDTRDGVTTLTMNDPKRLNGWTAPMMEALKAGFAQAAADPETKALILTGTGRYYCAGVNLGASVQLGHPKSLHAYIVEHNQGLFDMFINFPKPILIAVNGPAIGACVTSATLCDGIIASTDATFSTPFDRLGVPPEGCSSVMFPRLLGDAGQRMLGPEGFVPTAEEAEDIGLINWVVEADALMDEAQRIAKAWVDEGAERSYRAGATREELLSVNARESVQVADAFLSPPFLNGQFKFLWSKKKRVPALTFLALRLTHPLWSLLL